MKKLAARDFEDILQVRLLTSGQAFNSILTAIKSQVAIPCFENLLPEPFNGYVLDLLFDLALYLSYGKLRQHTDSTLSSFEACIKSLGSQIRKFTHKTCPRFQTKETPQEQSRRERQAAAKRAKDVAAAAATGREPPVEKAKKGTKWKSFNLRTYKLHALGDYIPNIWLFGTTDSYSTQIVSYRCAIIFYSGLNCYRASWSTVELNVFTLEQTRTSLLANAPDKNVVSDSCGSSKNRQTNHYRRQLNFLLVTLYRSHNLRSIITSQTQTDFTHRFNNGSVHS